MKFCQITARTNTLYSEAVADIFWDYTAYGVAILDSFDVLQLQKSRDIYWDYIDENILPDGGALVKCFIPLDEADKIIAEIAARLEKLKEYSQNTAGSLELSRQTVDGDEWIDIWKKNFRPIKIGKVTICPSWIEHQKEPDQTLVLIGTDTAFGTGEHETTSMCIELMQGVVKEGDTVCDIGCGSGILGITALKLGAGFAVLTDIDSISRQCAATNAKINGVSEYCQIVDEKADLKAVNANLAFANITAEILIALSKNIVSAVKCGGHIILSGIIESKLKSVLECFRSLGLTEIKQISKSGWCAIMLKRAEK